MRKGQKLDDDTRRHVLELAQAGKSSDFIADQLGLAVSSVGGCIGALRRTGALARPRQEGAPVETPRKCLGGCGETFLSPHPKAAHRICPACAGRRAERMDYLPDGHVVPRR